MGFVFQFYNLMPVLTAQRNVELPLLLTSLPAAERRRRAAIALTLVGLADRRGHKPRELSGGQEQRVAIARAIVSDPTLLICDEPTGDLDRATAAEILTLLQMLNRDHGKTIVMVTHDPKAAEYAQRSPPPRQGQPRGQALTSKQFSNASRGGPIVWKSRPDPMRYLPLLWAGLFRKKTRTVLTLMSVFVAFLLFGLMQAVTTAFESGADSADAKRLLTTARYSIIELLPLSHLRQIEQVPGVVGVAHAEWFGAKYQNESNAFPVFAVEPPPLPRHVPGVHHRARGAGGLRRDARRRRRGRPPGRALRLEGRAEAADQLGDPPPGRRQPQLGVRPGRHPRRRGSRGARQHRRRPHQRGPLRRGPRARQGPDGLVHRPHRRLHAARAIAADIDRRFLNSPDETKTQPEKEFAVGFAKQIGDIGALVTRILAAVFFTILIMTGNTMAQSVRERIPELAILKTLGFSDGGSPRSSSRRPCCSWSGRRDRNAGAAGVLPGLNGAMGGALSPLYVTASTWLVATALVLGLALAVGLPPALRARRLRIVDALAGQR